MSSTQVNPIGGNQYYDGLHHTSSNAVELSLPLQDNSSSYKTINASIRTNGLTAGTVFKLAGPLPLGTVFTSVSLNGHQQVLPGTTNTYALGLSSSPTLAPTTALNLSVPPVGGIAAAVPAPIGFSINGSSVNLNTAPVTPVVSTVTGQYVTLAVPVVGVGVNADTGSFDVTLVYYSP